MKKCLVPLTKDELEYVVGSLRSRADGTTTDHLSHCEARNCHALADYIELFADVTPATLEAINDAQAD